MRPSLLFLVLAVAGCAHAPAQFPTGPRPAWPPPPAAPAVRWATTFPSPYAPRRGVSGWRHAFNVIFGLSETPRVAAPLARPFGIAIVDGKLLVADPDARQVLQIDWRRGTSEPIGCRERAWEMPIAVTGGPDGALYVADAGAHVVVRHDRRGCSVIGAGVLERPTGLVFAAGRLYVIDAPRHQVHAFSSDGREQLRFGQRGDGSAALNFPTAVAASGAELLVVDALHFRIARYSADGQYLGSFGEPGDGSGAFGRPKAVAVDEHGRIYVSDAQNDVVVRFDAGGNFQLAVGQSGVGVGELSLPAGVAVGGGFLFVADSYNRRVQIYELLEEAP